MDKNIVNTVVLKLFLHVKIVRQILEVSISHPVLFLYNPYIYQNFVLAVVNRIHGKVNF